MEVQRWESLVGGGWGRLYGLDLGGVQGGRKFFQGTSYKKHEQRDPNPPTEQASTNCEKEQVIMGDRMPKGRI